MGFLEEYAALESAGQPQQVAAAQIGLLQKWAVGHANELFAELREKKPIFFTPGPIVVSLYRDVMEIVQLDDVFGVGVYGQSMMQVNDGPNFILGMDSGPELQRDQSILRLAVRRDDVGAVSTIASQAACSLIEAAMPKGRLELTEELGRAVPASVVEKYFGVPGPDRPTLLSWVRAIFQAIFLNFAQDPQVAHAGEEAGAKLRSHVDGLIAQAKSRHGAGEEIGDSVLARLVRMQASSEASFRDDEIRNNLIGCVSGVLENVNTSVAGAVDVLLSRPTELAAASEAARAGERELVRRYVLEALRFHPPAPLLVRLSLRDHVLARGTEREVKIPAGKVVFAANGSAMMDGGALEEPESFRLDRPEHDYLHFGWGLHQCLGKYIAQAQLVEIFTELLSLKNLRRAPGDEGQMTHDGPFPGRFVVEFDGRT